MVVASLGLWTTRANASCLVDLATCGAECGALPSPERELCERGCYERFYWCTEPWALEVITGPHPGFEGCWPDLECLQPPESCMDCGFPYSLTAKSAPGKNLGIEISLSPSNFDPSVPYPIGELDIIYDTPFEKPYAKFLPISCTILDPVAVTTTTIRDGRSVLLELMMPSESGLLLIFGSDGSLGAIVQLWATP